MAYQNAIHIWPHVWHR